MTKKYEQYISLVKDPDFSEWWYESTSKVLSDYTFDFTEEDWHCLSREIHNLSYEAQEKCLYTIDEANPQCAFKIAIKLLDSDNGSVADQALSTINEAFSHIKSDVSHVHFFKDLENKIPDRPIAKKIYQSLKEKIEELR